MNIEILDFFIFSDIIVKFSDFNQWKWPWKNLLQVMTSRDYLQCSSCQQIFPTKEDYDDHKRFCHLMNSVLPEESTNPNSPREQPVLNQQDNLSENHFFVVDGLFKCVFCSYSSFRKQNISKHTRRHTGERPFGCSLCSYRAIQKHHVDNHMLTHGGLKPHACNLCPHRTTTKGNLKKHMFCVHGIEIGI